MSGEALAAGSERLQYSRLAFCGSRSDDEGASTNHEDNKPAECLRCVLPAGRSRRLRFEIGAFGGV